jgi:hypothetical protein
MAASSLVPLDKMNTGDYTGPVTASVMDYVAPNIACPGGQKQGPFINSHLGPYDVWAIACGYGPADKLKDALEQSSQKEHTFVSQAAMSFGSDPRNMTWDVGASNLDFCDSRMKLVADLRTKLTSDLVKDGEPWSKARERYEQLLGTQLRTLVIAASWVGGTYENPDTKGAPGAPACQDVPAADQRRAARLPRAERLEDGPSASRPSSCATWARSTGMTRKARVS